MKARQIADILWGELPKIITSCPENCSTVKKHTEKPAFFPVGIGAYGDGSSNIDILVLGQDFGTVDYYSNIVDGEGEDTSCKTWVNMLSLFKNSGIDVGRCFFSNVFTGLRNNNKMTGKYPGYRNKSICKNESISFLQKQIEIIKPKSIITLGTIPSQMLYESSLSGLEAWNKEQALKRANIGKIKNVAFPQVDSCICVAIEHPSMRYSNVGRRRYKEFSGNNAEIEMLKDMYSEING